jgi:cytochrome c-type biogenesis protein CcmE
VARAEAATAPSLLAPRRILVVLVLLAAVAIAFFAVQNLAPSTVYYLTPTEASQRHVGPGTPVRIGGLVLPGTLVYDPQSRLLTFALGDGTTNVAVVGNGAPPALLRENAGAVVEGAFAEDGTFRATSVIAKHDEQYAPPSAGQTPAHKTSP